MGIASVCCQAQTRASAAAGSSLLALHIVSTTSPLVSPLALAHTPTLARQAVRVNAADPLLAVVQGCGDHSNNAHYVSKQLDPDDVVSDCSLNHHAFFLLLVEPGVFLGANGWHEDYDKP